MEKLSQRIDDIAKSKDAEYIENVVQVKFNSWHYSDSNLWASMITEIFDSLSRYLKQSEKEIELRKISESLQITSMQKEVMEEKRRALESQINKLEEEKKRKREKLEDLSGIKLVRLILSDNKIKKDLGELNNDNVENITADANRLQQYQKEISDTSNVFQYYLKFLGDLKGWRWPFVIILMILVFITCYFIIPVVYPQRWEKLTLKVSGILSVVVAFIGNALALIKPVKKDISLAFQRLESMKETLDNRPEDSDPEAAAANSGLIALKKSLSIINEQIESARKEISDIVSGKRLLEFIETRTRDENYTRQLGLISWIRKDFNMLDELLRKQHEADKETKDSILNPHDVKLKIDRIILYIDDLDRCNENIVVKVLEAIHLLLAFPLFVVVVGVDPRWLNNALSEKYRLLFGAGKNGEGSDSIGKNKINNVDETDLLMAGSATSYDYLEKIFQIPFALKPINKDGREKLIKYLIRDEMFVAKSNGVPGNSTHTPPAKGAVEGGIKDERTNGDTTTVKTDVTTAEKQKSVERAKERLVFSKGELEYMQKISSLFGQTPRTINRYVNIYRIIKAHGNLKTNGEFDEEEFIPVMLLLGITVGNSVHAEKFIEEVVNADDKQSFEAFMKDSVSASKLNQLINPLVADIAKVPMKSFKYNIELISRFSFRTLLKEV